MSLLASHGSVRSSTTGKKLILEKFKSNPIYSYENGLMSAHPLSGKEGYRGPGHLDLEERDQEGAGDGDVLLFSSRGQGPGDLDQEERSQEEVGGPGDLDLEERSREGDKEEGKATGYLDLEERSQGGDGEEGQVVA